MQPLPQASQGYECLSVEHRNLRRGAEPFGGAESAPQRTCRRGERDGWVHELGECGVEVVAEPGKVLDGDLGPAVDGGHAHIGAQRAQGIDAGHEGLAERVYMAVHKCVAHELEPLAGHSVPFLKLGSLDGYVAVFHRAGLVVDDAQTTVEAVDAVHHTLEVDPFGQRHGDVLFQGHNLDARAAVDEGNLFAQHVLQLAFGHGVEEAVAPFGGNLFQY